MENNNRSEQLNELFAALAKAQSEMPIAGLNNNNPFFKSKYADFTDLVKASRPCLTKHGLSVTQFPFTNDNEQSFLHTILGHASGQWLESRMRIVPPKSDVQSLGSYITYLKRYAYASIVGVVAGDEDDDGEVAMQEARVTKAPAPTYDKKIEAPAKVMPVEYVTPEQLEQIEFEFEGHPAVAKRFLENRGLETLAQMPKADYITNMKNIRYVVDLEKGLKK